MPRYRIFCAAGERDRLPVKVKIDATYPAFVIATTSITVIEKVRQQFPVEELKLPKEPPQMLDLITPPKRGPYFYVVRFYEPIRPEWLEKIAVTGGQVCSALGYFTLVVKCSNKRTLAQLRRLPTKPRLTPYVPLIDEAILTDPNRLGMLFASFFTVTEQQRARRALRRHGLGDITTAGSTDLIIDLAKDGNLVEAVRLIANQKGLRSLEKETFWTPCTNKARLIVGSQVVTPKPEGLGLTGKGETIAVADTGLDTGDMVTIHKDLRGRVKEIWPVPLTGFWSSRVNNPGQNDQAADTWTGHGTHICGSILGNGTRARELGLEPIEGMAPEAELIFQALEHEADWNALGREYWALRGQAPPPAFMNVPLHLEELFQAAYLQGARIHCNAWGGFEREDYERIRRISLEQFVWDHKDFLVLVASGNGGLPDGEGVSLNSLTTPATAKNCLTVGATENAHGDDPHVANQTYGRNDPLQRWPNEPFYSDTLVEPDDIFAVSSRGPTRDGRRKPDVVAPGALMLSTRCAAAPLPDDYRYEPAPHDYMYYGGTSMATALVAGCAALVRQYLREYLPEDQRIMNPSAALIKAILIHSAQYYPYRFARSGSARWADYEQGWGRINLQSVLKPEPSLTVLFLDEINGLSANEARRFKLEVTDSNQSLRITLVYTDQPGDQLINNLNLSASHPDYSKTFWGNDFTNSNGPDSANNVEGMIIEQPATGTWSVQVTALIPDTTMQDFALVISGGGVKLIAKEEITE